MRPKRKRKRECVRGAKIHGGNHPPRIKNVQKKRRHKIPHNEAKTDRDIYAKKKKKKKPDDGVAGTWREY
jgi:hypothetical protein